MKNWSSNREAQVLFTENHWQTMDIMKLYLHLIKLTYASKLNVGMVIDKASMHDCEDLMEYVNESNKIPPFIYIKFIMENLTSVYSPPDITVIKDLKAGIRRKYDCLLSAKRKKRGDKVKVTREDVVAIVTSSFEDINKINETN